MQEISGGNSEATDFLIANQNAAICDGEIGENGSGVGVVSHEVKPSRRSRKQKSPRRKNSLTPIKVPRYEISEPPPIIEPETSNYEQIVEAGEYEYAEVILLFTKGEM